MVYDFLFFINKSTGSGSILFLTALLGGGELRTSTSPSSPKSFVPVLAQNFCPLAKSCSIQHRRPPLFLRQIPSKDCVNGEIFKVASIVPKNSVYHGNKDAPELRLAQQQDGFFQPKIAGFIQNCTGIKRV